MTLVTLWLHETNSFWFCVCVQIKKLLNKPVVRESCYYRKLTDRGNDEPAPSLNEAQIENLTGELMQKLMGDTVSTSFLEYNDVGIFTVNVLMWFAQSVFNVLI